MLGFSRWFQPCRFTILATKHSNTAHGQNVIQNMFHDVCIFKLTYSPKMNTELPGFKESVKLVQGVLPTSVFSNFRPDWFPA